MLFCPYFLTLSPSPCPTTLNSSRSNNSYMRVISPAHVSRRRFSHGTHRCVARRSDDSIDVDSVVVVSAGIASNSVVDSVNDYNFNFRVRDPFHVDVAHVGILIIIGPVSSAAVA